MPLPVRISLGPAVVAANGTATLTIAVDKPSNPTAWVLAVINATVGGDAYWTVATGNLPLGADAGSRARIGPIAFPRAELLTLSVANATPGSQVMGALSGVAAQSDAESAILAAGMAGAERSLALVGTAAPTLVDGQQAPLSLTDTGLLRVDVAAATITEVASTIGTPASVVASVASVTLLASNPARLGFSVFNDSTAVLYLLLASTAASATSYTAQVPANALYEPPVRYVGDVQGIWSAANGAARITELT